MQYATLIDNLISKFPDSEFYLHNLRRYIDVPTCDSPQSVLCLSHSAEGGLIQSEETPGHSNPSQKTPCLAIVEGFPSPEVINHLGAKYQLRPEVFLGHLEFERVLSQTITSFELPTLSSYRDNVVHVRLATLGRTSRDFSLRKTISSRQAKANDHARQIEKSLFEEKRYGATRYRKVNIHNSRYFSIEQMVTFTVGRDAQSWTGVFLLDSGTILHGERNLPWTSFASRPNQPSMLPTVRYNQGNVLDGKPGPKPRNFDGDFICSPYHPLKDGLIQDDLHLLPQDPFYMLSQLFKAAILSWAKILNLIEQDNLICQTMDAENSMAAIEQLHLNNGLLRRIEGYLEDNQETILHKGSSEWLRLDSDSLDIKMRTIQTQLTSDHEYLIKRCRYLAEGCRTTSDLLLKVIEVSEAKKSIQQSKQVAQLTKLAFFFYPLSFVATFFGMNVREITMHNPPVWVFFLVAVGTLFIAVLVLEYQRLLQLGAYFRKGYNEEECSYNP